MWRVPREDWPTGQDTRPRPLDLRADIDRWGADRATGAGLGSTT